MNRVSTVLVVEDDPYISDLITLLLEDSGYEVCTAATAASAYEQIESGSPDLVILDWMLPDTPGDQVCRVIKGRPGQSFLPILMLTARSTLADRVAGLDAGADDYLTKPFHADELMARTRALLRIRAAELERLQAISELRRAYEQLATTQAQLIHSSRLAALGELVAGVAHELNNPLGIILGNAELLPELEDSEDRRAVAQIIAGAQRARRIVQSMATFARQGKMEEDWYKPRDLIERVLDLKRADLRAHGIALEVEYEKGLPMLWADGAQIQQVLLNLVLNAEYALNGRPDPKIIIRVCQRHAPIPAPPTPLDSHDPGSNGGEPMVVIDVTDNGVGMDDELASRIFQPFVTTKPVGQGTGLGLAISYGIVSQHNGTLQFASVSGVGTTFRVGLPVSRANVPSAPALEPEFQVPIAGRIMIVDDEPDILDFITRLLSRHSWDVRVANRAEAAFQMVQDEQFDAILCDIKMPDMDGIAFYNRLQQLQGQPCPYLIIMTGDTNSARTDEFLRHTALPVLKKPFGGQELLTALAQSQA